MDKLEETLRAIVRDELQKALAEREPSNGDLISTTEAARLADVATATIRRWIKLGSLTKHHAGRVFKVSRAELESLLKNGVANEQTPERLAEKAFG